MKKIGMIGLGAMGKNLSLNMLSKGVEVIGYDINPRMREKGIAAGIKVVDSLQSLIDAFQGEKKIIWIMVPSSKVDNVLESLSKYLAPKDIIIDGGNSYFKDTKKRVEDAKEKGFFFIGIGISGGEEGALKGPSIMPGGEKDAYRQVESVLEAIAAKVDGEPCCTYIGSGEAGHFVKMVHNGIEYADMQLIGEMAWFFKNSGMKSAEIASLMLKWNGENDILRSYLIEITADGLREKDKETDGSLVDRVADITRMKGTGTWTVQSALELLVPIPTIAAAVFSREMSQDKDLRLKMSKMMALKNSTPKNSQTDELIQLAHDALYIAKISSYAQGTSLLKVASDKYDFNLNLGKIAKIWRAGCIIRAQFLDEIAAAYEQNTALPNLLAAPKFSEFVAQNIEKLGHFIEIAHQIGVPTLAMDSAYDYILQLCSPIMFSAQVAALQRDYFGAHGYFKIGGGDKPEVMVTPQGKVREFHTEWMLPGRPEKEITK